jgi:hypothetical protein
MKVTCIKCNEEYLSIGAHVQSFENAESQYVCLHCIVKEKSDDQGK